MPGETGRPLGVLPSQVHTFAPSASLSSSTSRVGPGAVLNSRTTGLCPGVSRCTTASAPLGMSSGPNAWLGPIDATRGRGGVVSSRTELASRTLRPSCWSVMR